MWWKLKSNTFYKVLHIPLRLVLWTTIYIMSKRCIWNIDYNFKEFKTSMDHAISWPISFFNPIPSINLILEITFLFYSNVYFNWSKLAKPTTFLSLLNLICWLRQSSIKTPAFFKISWIVPVGEKSLLRSYPNRLWLLKI